MGIAPVHLFIFFKCYPDNDNRKPYCLRLSYYKERDFFYLFSTLAVAVLPFTVAFTM